MMFYLIQLTFIYSFNYNRSF